MSRLSVSLGASADMSAVRQAIESSDNNFKELYLNAVDQPQGRLTLTSGVPVPSVSVSGATTVYYTPYCGQSIPIYDGNNFNMVDFGGELSNSLADATKNPAATVASSVYDLFVWNDAGVIRLSRGPVWTSATVRNLALARVRGVLVNATAITNGPAANMGTYVGTFATGGSNTTHFIFGTAASGGGSAILYVWNYYNRVIVNTRVTDSQVAYAYVTATPRVAGGAGNMSVLYCVGLPEDCPTFYYQQNVTTAALAGATAQVSIGDDATVFELGGTYFAAQAAIAATGTLDVAYMKGQTETIQGAHVTYALELGDGANSNLFNVGTAGELSCILRM
jgi:hypothetical protein